MNDEMLSGRCAELSPSPNRRGAGVRFRRSLWLNKLISYHIKETTHKILIFSA